MIVKKEKQTVFLFEKRTGMTALFSGKELAFLQEFAFQGVKTPFIHRLFDLGILMGDCSVSLRAGLAAEALFSPQSFHIDITNHCPLKCPLCYKKSSVKQDMPLTQFKQIIDEAKKLKVFQIAIGGGEPLCHPNITEYIHMIGATEMASSITTSGYGLSASLLEELTQAGLCHLQISLNGATAAVNGTSRDGYEYALHAMKCLSTSAISYGINFVARKDNIHDFLSVVALAKQYNANNVNILRYKPSPTENYADFCLEEAEFRQFANMVQCVRGIQTKVDSAYTMLLLYLNHGKINKNLSGCGAGKSFVAITNEGTFKPCSHISFTCTAPSIQQYWAEDPQLKQMRHFTENKKSNSSSCFSCVYFENCGGCRAICEHIYGDVWAAEVGCPVYERKY